jgi:DNA modification methylase
MKPYYQHAGITIYHGDCREILPFVKAHVLVTDPPYGVNLGKHLGAAETRPGFLTKQAYASYEDSYDNFRDTVVPGICMGLNHTRRAGVFCAGTMMWDLPRPAAVGGVYLPAACGRNSWGFASLAHVLLYGDSPQLNLGSRPIAISSTDTADAVNHPCPKPLSWMKWLIALCSRDAAEIVIDSFCGSGTTLEAAKALGHPAIGIEIEEKYCEIAAKRLSQEVLAFGDSLPEPTDGRQVPEQVSFGRGDTEEKR